MSRSVPRSTRETTTSRLQRRGSVTSAWQPRPKRSDWPECSGSRKPPPSAAFGLADRLIRWKRHLAFHSFRSEGRGDCSRAGTALL